jgi:hypothetical protein
LWRQNGANRLGGYADHSKRERDLAWEGTLAATATAASGVQLCDCDESLSEPLDHLREQRLIEKMPIGDHDHGVVLSDRDLSLLKANRQDRDPDDDGQESHAGVSCVREPDYDASLYEAYRAEEVRIRYEHHGAELHRIILDEDLKRVTTMRP